VMAQPRSKELSKLGGESSKVKLSQRIFKFLKDLSCTFNVMVPFS
jgi:hypothetical protein